VLLPPRGRAMRKQPSRRGFKNQVLAKLTLADSSLLAPHLEAVDLPLGTALETSSKRINTIYFLDRGFASVVANGASGRAIEVGIIGREGMTGLPVVLGHDRAARDTYIQVAGSGWAIAASKLKEAMHGSGPLHRSLLRCVHAFMLQTTETGVANGRSKNEERLARWLLLADDRLERGELPLTHKLLAIMLGGQRPGVTLALQVLQRKGLIRAGRGIITILDRKGLAKFSNGAYLPPG
jgi:CRP-like cAMP-binding protein